MLACRRLPRPAAMGWAHGAHRALPWPKLERRHPDVIVLSDADIGCDGALQSASRRPSSPLYCRSGLTSGALLSGTRGTRSTYSPSAPRQEVGDLPGPLPIRYKAKGPLAREALCSITLIDPRKAPFASTKRS